MSDIAIRCEGLSKRYRLGERESYKALRDVISDAAAAPFRRLRTALSNGSAVGNGRENGIKGDDFWALNDVSFEVKRGEVVGIIGRNGAGKSTLLKILSRITKPTSGHAEIHGRVGSLLEVGTGFHPELSGRENIFLNGAILGMRKTEIERKFDEIVAFAEIEKFIDTPVKRYSSGMYVRLAFAVAAHLEPEILVVDEVLAVGDAAFQKKCLGRMGEVAKGGRTVLFVSHNMGAVRSLCQEAILLNNGRVIRKGTSPDVVEEYLTGLLVRSGSEIDLRKVARHGGFGERLKITQVTFNRGRPIFHGERLTIEIEFETKTRISDVAFGVGFSLLEGTRILTVDSDFSGARKNLDSESPTACRAELATVPLQPGCYALDIAARSGPESTLDYLPSCAEVEVLPGPSTPGFIIRQAGGVRLPASWEWDGARVDTGLSSHNT